jgi:hypothetical protein
MPSERHDEPFYLIVTDKDNETFSVEGPMTDNRQWNRAVVVAQKSGRQVTCSTENGSSAEDAARDCLMGVSAVDRAIVEMWNRRVELELFRHIGNYFQHTNEIFRNRIRQIPAVAEASRETTIARMKLIDELIADRRFIAGERYTIADITALCAVGLGEFAGLAIDPGMKNLTRWYAEVSARPSAKA